MKLIFRSYLASLKEREELDAIPGAGRRRAWPEQEKLAEAFAAWFLMPRRIS